METKDLWNATNGQHEKETGGLAQCVEDHGHELLELQELSKTDILVFLDGDQHTHRVCHPGDALLRATLLMNAPNQDCCALGWCSATAQTL